MAEPNHKHEITFFVNNQPVHTTQQELTGAQIKELAKVPPDYELYEVRDGQTERVADTQAVRIHEGLRFRAIPPGTFGKNAAAA